MAAASSLAAMRLGELLGADARSHGALAIRDLVLDSRQVSPGAAFVALPGTRTHGLAFAAEAFARGASIVLYEPDSAYPQVPEPSLAIANLSARIGKLAVAFFGRPAPATKLAGITGTNGKTTVAYLLAQAVTQLEPSCGYLGTLGFGVPPALDEHALTTPDCFTLHKELARLATRRVAMEVSSHALAQDRIAGLTFDCAAFTNLTRDHLDQHGDLAAYGAAKARLFERADIRAAIVNLDDPFGGKLTASLRPGVLRIGTSQKADSAADLEGRVTERGLGGLSIAVAGRYGAARIESPLIGSFNAENLLVALGVMLAWELPLGESCAALSACRPAPGRMQVVRGRRGGPTVVVDYAHTPDALERVLSTLRAACAGGLVCVFGCGGDRDASKRPAMGAAAASLADRVVLTDDNPRSEDPEAITADIRFGIAAGHAVEIEHDRAAAIAHAIRAAEAGDTILIAGKGHERWQLLGGAKRPFSDEAAASAALEAWN